MAQITLTGATDIQAETAKLTAKLGSKVQLVGDPDSQ